MTVNHSPVFGHADNDALLIRYVDGEMSAAERTAFESRLDAEPQLVARLQVLERRSRNLRAMLEAVQPTDIETKAAEPFSRVQPQSQHRPSRFLRAAAIILLLLAGAAVAVPPVRAWVWQAIRGEDPAPTEVESATVPPTAEPADSLTIRFAAPGTELHVSFAATQTEGSLRVRWEGTETVLRIVGRYQGEDPVVMPDGVRVLNRSVSTANYELTAPAGVEAVRVVIGSNTVLVQREAGESVVPLSR